MPESDIAFLLSEEVQKYITTHLYRTPADLLLASSPYSKSQMTAIVGQIQARRKAQTKLPAWFATSQIIYPPVLSLEQCSSEVTAHYKKQVISGNTLADLTGGFGVDACYFAQVFDQVHYIEQNKALVEVVQHNLTQLGITNVQTYKQTAEEFTESLLHDLDAVYIDPARRDQQKNKVFRLEDCTPNLLELLPNLWQKTNQVLIKLSPMLDIDLGVEQLGNVAEVIIVALNNECKELLFLLKKGFRGEALIKTVNLSANKQPQSFDFTRIEESVAQVEFAEPQQYLYEPNVAILKGGAFKQIAQHFGLAKLHLHSHLYTSNTLIADFPGRSFKVKAVCKYAKKEVMKHLTSKKANITARNFTDSVAVARKKLNLKDGGEDYVFVTQTNAHKALVIITGKV